MSYTWFKLHHELPDDIKLRMFTPQEKWAWVALLCLASKSSERGVIRAKDSNIAAYCEFNTTQDWLYYRDKLIAEGMLDFTQDGALRVQHWNDRQYDKPSDRPEAVKARVAKHRAKKKEQKNDEVTPCNAIQTPSNADVTIQTRLEETKEETDQITHTEETQPDQKACVRDSFPLPHVSSATQSCDRGFERFGWGYFSDPDQEFLNYLATVYLPSLPSNEGKKIGIHAAKTWLIKAKYDNQRLDTALIQFDAFVEWRDGTESTPSTSPGLKTAWAQQIEQLWKSGEDGHDFYKLPSGQFDQEKYKFYWEYIDATQPA